MATQSKSFTGSVATEVAKCDFFIGHKCDFLWTKDIWMHNKLKLSSGKKCQ